MAGDVGAGVVQMPALGQPFQNGMMYDCRTNTLIPWITLWDPEVLRENTTTRVQESSDFQVITQDTLSEKTHAMDMNASLRLSFISGLVPVSGSAKYLNNHKTSMHQERITLVYKYTTRFEELTMKHLQKENMKYNAVYEHRTATHVVVGIAYGGNAFFLFDRVASASENKREIRGDLKMLAEMITATGAMDTSENLKSEQVRCQFYGDMLLPKNPATYSEAVQLCKEMPQLVQQNADKAVPVMVWLYPLYLLDPSAARVEQGINPSIAQRFESCLESLREIDVRCSDLLQLDICDFFMGIREDVQTFQRSVSQYLLKFKRDVFVIIQSTNHIEGTERVAAKTAEQGLSELLVEKEQSPFQQTCLFNWVRERETQLQVFNNYMQMEGVKCISSAELHVEFLKPDNRVVTCFEINLGDEDQQTQNMEAYLTDVNVKPVGNPTSSVADVAEAMAHSTHLFRDFASANVDTPGLSIVIVEKRNSKMPQGGFLRIYKKGTLISQDCELLVRAPRVVLDSVSHDRINISWNATHRDSCPKYYEVCYKKADHPGAWTVIQLEKTDCLLNDLLAGEKYLIKVRSVCKDWFSAYSQILEITTHFSSRPGTPTIQHKSRRHVLLEWLEPDVVAMDREVDSYTILSQSNMNGTWQAAAVVPTTDGKTFQHEVKVEPGIRYVFKIAANCDGKVSAASEESAEVMVSAIDADWLRDNGYGTCTAIGGGAARQVYQVKLNEARRVGMHSTHSYFFGYPEPGMESSEKTVLLVGGSEAHKDKLLDGMLNYILGVEYSDPYRFVLRGDQNQLENDIEMNQTHLIVYKIYCHHGFTLPFILNIVYTPDFGDDLEDASVQEMVLQLEGHLSAASGEGGIGHIDLICFTRHASITDPSPMQICVFNSILALLGTSAAENIVTLLTYDDDGEQVSLGSGNIITEGTWYRFNTSAILAGCSDDTNDAVNQIRWQLEMKNFKTFFEYLSAIQPMDLQQTKQFLSIRNQFEDLLGHLYNHVHSYYQLQVEYKFLQQNTSELKNNRKLTYSFTECVAVKPNCLVRQYTANSREVVRRKCDGDVAMPSVKDQMTVRKSVSDLWKRYEDVAGRTLSVQELISQLHKELEARHGLLKETVKEICKYQTELKGLALVPYPWSLVTYLDVLIETEQEDKFQGWDERVQVLRGLKEHVSQNIAPPAGWCVIQ